MMGLYLSLVSILLLALVAGLLLALWVQLRGWRDAGQTAPLLAETLANQLLTTRNGLAELKKALVSQGPELERLLGESSKARTELQYLLQRAEHLAERIAVSPGPSLAQAAAVVAVEHVAGANGVASARGASPPAGPTRPEGDPLETLLAGLNAAAETPLELTVRRSRVGPVTQAELDLQQQVRRSAAKDMPKRAA